MIPRQLHFLLVAVQFLTRLPIPFVPGFEPDDITRAARYFPLVGQGVGALSALALLIAARLWPGGWIAPLIALALGILITGAFHEDGLADTADGLGGGQTPERRLEIMRDSRVGSYGVAALSLCLALKVSALSTLSLSCAVIALIAAHGLGRAVAVLVMRLTPYAPDATGGKWKPTPQGVTTGEVVIACAIAAWPLLALGGAGLVGVLAGLFLAVALALLTVRLIGGHTGDVLGGVEQVFEVGFLLGLTAVIA